MIKGFFFDGKSSSKSEAILYVDSIGQYHLDNENDIRGEFPELKISSRIGNTARYISFPDGSQFETQDNDAVDELVQTFSKKTSSGLIHKLESTKSIIISTMIGVVLFAWVFIQYGIPHFSHQIAMMLPENIPQLLGQGVLESMDKHLLAPTELDESKQQELHTLFNNIKSKIGDLKFIHLELRKGGKLNANAFALPDGTIVFTDEIINLAENLQEIEAIMFHEIGHIEHRHALRSVIQQFSLALFVMVITGDVSTSSSIITALPVILVEAGFSQDMEWEADTFALTKMQQYDVNPIHFANMMSKLASYHEDALKAKGECNKKEDKPDCKKQEKPDETKETEDEISIFDYLSTHPPTSKRIDRFKQHSH